MAIGGCTDGMNDTRVGIIFAAISLVICMVTAYRRRKEKRRQKFALRLGAVQPGQGQVTEARCLEEFMQGGSGLSVDFQMKTGSAS